VIAALDIPVTYSVAGGSRAGACRQDGAQGADMAAIIIREDIDTLSSAILASQHLIPEVVAWRAVFLDW
jgi:hypothetical protein